jgi:uncharacterized membrane protein
MNTARAQAPRLEWLLAGLLHYGTWLASAAIGLGVSLALIDSRQPAHLPGMRIATIGIALLILLPSSRVLLMLVVFVRERDYHFGIIAALVLTIIFLGVVVGMRTAS